jgi:predicted short-subunit dehydrogenase-like oxidoreductase (DUF2520 family)
VSARRRVGLVGPGRLGTLVAHAFAASGARMVHVAGGSEAARQRLTGAIAGLRAVDVADAADGVDVLVLAVPDAAIAGVVDGLVRSDRLGDGHGVVHLAGVHGLAPLRRAGLAGARVAACHPVLTAPSGATDPTLLHGAAWAVTAPDGDRAWTHELVTELGGDAFDVPEATRPLYHAALAVSSNAVGAAVVTALRLLGVAGVADPARLVGPLARASLDAALAGGAAALTGPVVRGEVSTIAAHLAAMAPDMPELATAYRAHARAVLAAVRVALEPVTAARLEALLQDPAS